MYPPQPQAKKRFDEDEAFKKASQLSVVTLQSGDEFSLKCWKTLCDVSRIQFKMVSYEFVRIYVFARARAHTHTIYTHL